MPLSSKFIFLLTVLIVTGCQHSPLRLPSSFSKPVYDAKRVQLLKVAAEHGVFFLIPETVIRDLPVRSAGDKCRKTEEGQWIENVYSTLAVLKQNPALADKIHMIEFKRGDRAQAEVSRDLDGVATLILYYSRIETRDKIRFISDIPCSGDLEQIGKDLSVTKFEWPTRGAISMLLHAQPERASVERMNIDKRFPIWLAEHMTLFRITPELTFEKTPQGESLLPVALTTLANELPANQDQLEYWLSEISKRSKIGGSVKFFGLKKDLLGSTGLQVDTAGKFVRKMNGYSDPTYPYVSYKVDNGAYVFAGLAELRNCLGELSDTYRSPLSLLTAFDSDPESFMAPGYHCQAGEKK